MKKSKIKETGKKIKVIGKRLLVVKTEYFPQTKVITPNPAPAKMEMKIIAVGDEIKENRYDIGARVLLTSYNQAQTVGSEVLTSEKAQNIHTLLVVNESDIAAILPEDFLEVIQEKPKV